MNPLELRLHDLTAAYGPGRPIVDHVDLTVAPGSFTALLGPSGCGKTTLLKTVAGLLDPQTGDITVGGRSLLELRAEHRPVALVFQKPLLFTHLSVADNVAFGLRMRGIPKPARRRRAAQMLELVGLPGFADRRVGQLSGGQEQRVALARALVLDPPVLLCDEPFSQLDADLRAHMRELLHHLHRELSITTLFVTHDQHEAVELADHIALLLHGRIEAHGPPAEFYTRPATLAAARFFGATNEIPGTLSGTEFTSPLGPLRVAEGARPGPGMLVVRPEAVGLRHAGADGENTVHGVTTQLRFHGTHQTATIALPAGLTLCVAVDAAHPLGLGEQVAVHLPPAACTVLPHPLSDGDPMGSVPQPVHESERSRA